MAAIECVELTKEYGKGVVALNNVTLKIETGASFGLLGENGAGKSTLVRILMGFIHPTSGRVRILGEEQIMKAHKRIGYIHERPIFETRFTGKAYLQYLGKLAGLWGKENTQRITSVLEMVHLREVADRAIGIYSKGMLQRLAIAQALIARPELLILDEPTSGLDPRSQWEVKQIIQVLREQGITILLCSHYLAEIEELCDSVGILRRGQLILSGSVADLLQAQGIVEIVLGSPVPAQEIAQRLQITEEVIESRGNVLHIKDSAQSSVLARLIAENTPIISLNPVSRTLEEVYVHTTQSDNSPQEPEIKVPTYISGGGA
ncbi:MAG TPA: ABC transporter ATP-binding protein [Ktedonobacteraceae bacterium]